MKTNTATAGGHAGESVGNLTQRCVHGGRATEQAVVTATTVVVCAKKTSQQVVPCLVHAPEYASAIRAQGLACEAAWKTRPAGKTGAGGAVASCGRTWWAAVWGNAAGRDASARDGARVRVIAEAAAGCCTFRAWFCAARPWTLCAGGDR